MRVALFCHSLLSDWNHGNAHFLRGVVTELLRRGHDVRVFEPRRAWSVENMVADHGEQALEQARRAFPWIRPIRYDEDDLDLDLALDGCALALVHEWNSADLVRRIGERRRRGGRCAVLFHDTHHRAVTRPEEIARFDLTAYDGILAFGESLRERYAAMGWGARAWTWHEAADTATFRRLVATDGRISDVAWIGNWGDEERTRELDEYLFTPAGELGVSGSIFGVRYPDEAKRKISASGLRYGGWLPNFLVPAQLAVHRVAIHVPRRAYVERLPGIPTIRVFESLACGAALICAPWSDTEGLFAAGRDYRLVRSGGEMKRAMRELVNDAAACRELGEHGRATVIARHTCAHRVDELLAIMGQLDVTEGTKGESA